MREWRGGRYTEGRFRIIWGGTLSIIPWLGRGKGKGTQRGGKRKDTEVKFMPHQSAGKWEIEGEGSILKTIIFFFDKVGGKFGREKNESPKGECFGGGEKKKGGPGVIF